MYTSTSLHPPRHRRPDRANREDRTFNRPWQRSALKALHPALELIRGARRAYLNLNIAYYGLVVCGMAYTAFDRSLQQSLTGAVSTSLTEGPLSTVLDAYTGGRAIAAIALTVGINLAVGSFATVTLPSMIIPFSGLLMGGIRALVWGVLFSPQISGGLGVPELVTGALLLGLIFLEGQGYVLAMFGAVLHGKVFLFPRHSEPVPSLVEGPRRAISPSWQGYLLGLKQQAQIYLLVAIVLFIAALYEVGLALVAAPALLSPR